MRAGACYVRGMGSYTIHIGDGGRVVEASTWLEALGITLGRLRLLDGVQHLACEVLPNGSVVIREPAKGLSIVVSPGEHDVSHTATPAGVPDAPGVPLSLFHTNLGHELRTPLNSILGYTGMLLEEAADVENHRAVADLRHVQGAARDLLELIDAGLEASRLTTEGMRLQKLTFEVGELVEDAVAALEAELSRAENTVSIRMRGKPGRMRADPNMVRDTLIELILWANARVERATITVEVAVEVDADTAEWIEVTVTDGGPPHEGSANRLFDPFTEEGPVGSATRTLRRATCRARIRRMRGDVSADTDARGRAALIMRLPRGR